ncbi:hypothetical protein VTI74DRAFT_11101 [Chaetomium olivicolor]
MARFEKTVKNLEEKFRAKFEIVADEEKHLAEQGQTLYARNIELEVTRKKMMQLLAAHCPLKPLGLKATVITTLLLPFQQVELPAAHANTSRNDSPPFAAHCLPSRTFSIFLSNCCTSAPPFLIAVLSELGTYAFTSTASTKSFAGSNAEDDSERSTRRDQGRGLSLLVSSLAVFLQMNDRLINIRPSSRPRSRTEPSMPSV